jgi:hypothetical protein
MALSPLRSVVDVDSDLDELERLGHSDSTQRLVEELLPKQMSAGANIRFDALLTRLVREAEDHRYHRAWMVHAANCQAYRTAWARATAILDETGEESPVAPAARLTAAGATFDLGRNDLAQQYVEQMIQFDDPPSPRMFRAASRSGLFERAAEIAAKIDPDKGRAVLPPFIDRNLAALHNSQLETCKRVKLVSLGQDCTPWENLNSWGLRVELAEDWWRMPFSQSVWRPSGALAALEDRFEQLPEAKKYRYISSPRGLRIPHHREYGATLNHEGFLPGQSEESERVDYAVEDGALQARNFLDQGCRGPRLYLHWLKRPIDLERLEATLSSLARDDEYLLLVIDECRDPSWKRAASGDRLIVQETTFEEPEQEWASRVAQWIRYEGVLVERILDAMDRVAGTA